MRPPSYDASQLDAMLRQARVPKVHAWLVNDIENEELRPRAIAIGNRLGVLKDYPTPLNCTSPSAPIWITEIVACRQAK